MKVITMGCCIHTIYLNLKSLPAYLRLSNIRVKAKTPLSAEEIPSCEPVSWELGNKS